MRAKMIIDYPKIRGNELYFGYLLRYHKYTGTLDLKKTYEELFGGKVSLNSTIFLDVPPSLDDMQIKITDYTTNHSAASFFAIFVSRQFLEDNRVPKPREWYKALPNKNRVISTGCSKLWYCPECHKEAPYYTTLKISHQIPGVYSCEKHKCYLKTIPLSDKNLLVKPEEWEVSSVPCTDKWFNGIAKDMEHIFYIKPDLHADTLFEGIWNAIVSIYEKESFETVEKSIKENLEGIPEEYRTILDDFKLSRYLTVDHYAKTMPHEYLLLIRALCGSFEAFLNYI